MRLMISILCVSATAGARPIHGVAQVQEHFEVQVRGDRLVTYPRVIAGTPTLTAELNDMIASFAGVRGVYESLSKVEGATHTSSTECELGVATDAFVSLSCTETGSDGAMGGGGYRTSSSASFYIDKGQLREATLANVFIPKANAKLEALAGNGDAACHVDLAHDVWTVRDGGIAFGASDSGAACLLTWEQLSPFLVADNPSKRRAPADDTPATVDEWAKAPRRFVAAEKDAVLDNATSLVWAAHDNGADLTWQAASAFAAAYRGGGHTDWRLPTERELEMLAEPQLAHRDKADCTKGKNAVALTDQIHISCGLAWSSTAFDVTRFVAFGFISGTSRIAALTENKNYRALVVRGKGP
jgi:hypothetical protein